MSCLGYPFHSARVAGMALWTGRGRRMFTSPPVVMASWPGRGIHLSGKDDYLERNSFDGFIYIY